MLPLDWGESHYNRHRYYDPQSGRFVSKDPIGLAGGINVYQYAPNSIEWAIRWGWIVWEAARTWGCRDVHVPNAALTSRSFTGRSIASSHQRSRPSGLLNRKQRACIPGPRRTRVWEWFESMHMMDLCQTGSEDLSSLHRLNQPVSFRAAW
ncbi:RHS repeat-associated core domain-containing protein [Burkholderia sp. BKH01]|nr:RHS repeat-associated core domain-containing protein [Burkholderia sp. BKH01]